MELVVQPKGSNLCGQACVAMILACSLQEAIALVGKKGKTYTRDLLRAMKVEQRRLKTWKSENVNGLLLARVLWNDKKRRHWVVVNEGVVYDPVGFQLPLADYLGLISETGKISACINLTNEFNLERRDVAEPKGVLQSDCQN